MESIPCKVCDLFKQIEPDIADEINDMILDREVSAEFAADAISKFLGSVGVTTVKKHRREKHV